MLALSAGCLTSYDALLAAGLDFESHTTGLMFVALTEARLDRYLSQLRELVAFGYPGEVSVLTAAEARNVEPALTHQVAGAIVLPLERHIHPSSFVGAMRNACLERGVTLLEGTEAVSLDQRHGRVKVRTQSSHLDAGAVIVAAGVWSRRILATARIRLPIEAAKGYSLTVPGPPRVSIPLYLAEARAGISPFRDSTRLAGTLEFAGLDTTIDPRRTRKLSHAARNYIQDWPSADAATVWTGLRPIAPDGLPIIGKVPTFENLFVATAHGMVGITMAPVTAELLCPIVMTGQQRSNVAAFSPGRFQ
jgi:D-amino-acid dehydrogenase